MHPVSRRTGCFFRRGVAVTLLHAIFRQLAKYLTTARVKTMTIQELLNTTKALADRNRVRLALALSQYDELCACQLNELLGVSGATTSRHLAVLANAGIVEGRKGGRWVYYRLQRNATRESTAVGRLMAWVRNELEEDPATVLDRENLEKIVAANPRALCRKQRGDPDLCTERDDGRLQWRAS